MLIRLASMLIRRRRLAIGVWATFVALAIVIGGSAIDRLATEAVGDTTAESAVAADRLATFGQAPPDVVAVIDGIDLTRPTTQQEIQNHVDRITTIAHVVDVADPINNSPLLVSTDGAAIMVAVTIEAGLNDEAHSNTVDSVAEELRSIEADSVLIGGQAIFAEEQVEQTEKDLQKAELLSLPVVLVLAVMIFGGLLGASMPLAVALVSIPGTLLILRVLTTFTDIHIFALNAATMLGLGLAVDYALLIVNRFREERATGLTVEVSVERTLTTAGRTVLFSGLTVAVALGGFLMLSGNVFPSIGLGSIGVVVLAMVVSLTLLPAMLAAWGHRIRPAKPNTGGSFRRIAELVQTRPLIVITVVVGALLIMGSPFLSVRLQIPGAEGLPSSTETRQVFDQREERFIIGGDDPITVLVETIDPAEIDAFASNLGALDAVVGVQVRGAFGATTVIDVLPDGASQSPAAEGVVGSIRELDPPFETAVTGPAADLMDQRASLLSRLPFALGFVAMATLVLLFMLTGSVVVPIKALIMNTLSLSATFGVLVWGFQNGNLTGVLGFEEVGYLSLWLPFLVFFIAFGLSMDYEVFLLSRIKEIYDETGDNDSAVAEGLQRTGRIITSAAILIGVVFAAFATGATVEIKALGIGFAVAILLDATVVRTLLVPAAMRLMGDWNWWAPAPLRRFHDRFGFSEAPSASGVEAPDDLRGFDGGPSLGS